MYKLGYWVGVLLLAAMTIASFRLVVLNGWTATGMFALFATLFFFAVFLSFTLSMRDRDRRSPPIAR